ncbi:hypothetical protein CF8_0039 [Aeromonas phage CF8]|nr:hypothetical protein CF8_0039 [Aeromonas phage CF8]
MCAIENNVVTESPEIMTSKVVNLDVKIEEQCKKLLTHFNRKTFNKDGNYTRAQIDHVYNNYLSAVKIYLETFFQWYSKILTDKEPKFYKELLNCYLFAIEDTCPPEIEKVVALQSIPPIILQENPQWLWLSEVKSLSDLRTRLLEGYMRSFQNRFPDYIKEIALESTTQKETVTMSKPVQRLSQNVLNQLYTSHGVDERIPFKVAGEEGTCVIYKRHRVKFDRVAYWEMTDEMVKEAVDLITAHCQAKDEYKQILNQLNGAVCSGDDNQVFAIDHCVKKLVESDLDTALIQHGFKEIVTLSVETKRMVLGLILNNQFKKNKIANLTEQLDKQAKSVPAQMTAADQPHIKQPEGVILIAVPSNRGCGSLDTRMTLCDYLSNLSFNHKL